MLNNIVTKETVLAEARELATTEGKSSNAKIEMLITMAVGAAIGKIEVEDVEDIFDAYKEARDAVSSDAAATGMSEGYVKKTKSEWRAVVKCGKYTLAEGPETIRRAADLARENNVHVYDSLIKVSREQIKLDHDMTDDEIKAAIAPEKEAAEYTEQVALEAAIKALEKIASGTEGNDKAAPKPAFPSEQLASAIGLLNQRLSAIRPAKDAGVAALMSAGYTEAMAKKLLKGTR